MKQIQLPKYSNTARAFTFGAVLVSGLMISRPARALNVCDGCGGEVGYNSGGSEAVLVFVPKQTSYWGIPEKPKEKKNDDVDSKHVKPVGGCTANLSGK